MITDETFVEGDRFRVKHDLKIVDKRLWGKVGRVIKWEYNDMYNVIIDGRDCLLRACEMEKIDA